VGIKQQSEFMQKTFKREDIQRILTEADDLI
jgi:hypothetical protein